NYLEGVEASDGVSLGPQADPAGREGVVASFHHEPATKESLKPISVNFQFESLPLSQSDLRRAFLDRAPGTADIAEEHDVVLQCVGPEDVVVVLVLDTEDDSRSLIVLARDRLEPNGGSQIGVHLVAQAERWEFGPSSLTQNVGRRWCVGIGSHLPCACEHFRTGRLARCILVEVPFLGRTWDDGSITGLIHHLGCAATAEGRTREY